MYDKEDQEEQEENKENKEYIWPILMLNVLYEVGGSQERDSLLSSSSPFRAREQVGGQGGLLILGGTGQVGRLGKLSNCSAKCRPNLVSSFSEATT